MNNKFGYKEVWVGSLLLMLVVGIFSYVRVTYADFNGITGQLGNFRKVVYYSNYPEESNYTEGIHSYTDLIHSNYFIESIMFPVPSVKYVFYSWNTSRDGSGVSYKVGKYYKLEDNLTLYAIWGRHLLGDINLDGKVDSSDYLLLSNHIGDDSFLTGVVLSNADVNLDGVVDLVDIDIIKQACFGTSGYTELLSNNPVFVYEIYKPNNINNNNSGGNSSNGNGAGNNNGATNNNGNSNNNGNGNSNSSGNGSNGNNIDEDSNVDIDDVVDSIDNNDDSKKNFKNYLWIFLIVLFSLSFRIVIAIIKGFKHKYKIKE